MKYICTGCEDGCVLDAKGEMFFVQLLQYLNAGHIQFIGHFHIKDGRAQGRRLFGAGDARPQRRPALGSLPRHDGAAVGMGEQRWRSKKSVGRDRAFATWRWGAVS